MKLTINDELVIDVFIHIAILFTFLYFFFFNIISKTGEQVLEKNIKDICNYNLKPIIKKVDDFDKEHGNLIDWNKVESYLEYIKNNPDLNIDKRNEESNNYYKRLGLIIAGSLIVLSIIMYLYFVYYKGSSINIIQILKENALLFTLIGLIEFIFFKVTGSNYIPAYPTMIGKIVLDRTKENIQNIL